METTNTNSKILTVAFAIAGGLAALTFSMLLKALSSAFGVIAALNGMFIVHDLAPVAIGLIVFGILQFNPRVHTWGQEVVAEISKVVWPSRKDVVAMTIVVCVMVMISSVIISAFDFMAGYIVKMLAS